MYEIPTSDNQAKFGLVFGGSLTHYESFLVLRHFFAFLDFGIFPFFNYFPVLIFFAAKVKTNKRSQNLEKNVITVERTEISVWFNYSKNNFFNLFLNLDKIFCFRVGVLAPNWPFSGVPNLESLTIL